MSKEFYSREKRQPPLMPPLLNLMWDTEGSSELDLTALEDLYVNFCVVHVYA